MSIAVQVHHRRDPEALAELIAAAMQDNVIIDSEPAVAHLSELLTSEEREAEARRETWRWLNSIGSSKPGATTDRDNDWSDV
jgi:hypothetical protein